MDWKPPNPLTVIVDTREKKPAAMPKLLRWYPVAGGPQLLQIKTTRFALSTGDYALQLLPAVAVAEKKGCIEELYSCVLGADWQRFTRQLDRMAAMPYAMLLLTMPVRSLTVSGPYSKKPQQMTDRLLRMTTARKLPVYFFPPSRDPTRTGEFIIRWLLAALVAHDISLSEPLKST